MRRRWPETRTIHLVLAVLDPVTGLLPAGRHVCAKAEVESAFVTESAFSSSTTRATIWGDWQNALNVLQSAALVRAAWIGGSFTTAKMDPEDIDVTFIIDGADMRGRTPQDQQIIALFAGGARSRPASNSGLMPTSFRGSASPRRSPGWARFRTGTTGHVATGMTGGSGRE
jgi:hypothetical protein